MTTSEFIDAFNEHRMFVFFFCKKQGYSQEDAEDLTSQVFISLWKRMDSVKADTIQQYIVQIAKNKCIDLLRYKNTRIQIISTPVYEDITEDIEEVKLIIDVISHIHDIIESLPPKQKAFVKMKYIDERKPAQIAKIFKLEGITVRNQLHTALSTIRKELKNRGFNLS